MATLKQVRNAARELDRADDLVDSLQSQKNRLQSELAEVNTSLDAAKTDRDAKKNALKTLVSELV
jgi:prefoldin subunit 5